MSPNLGKAIGDIEVGRKATAWVEPRAAADIADLEGLPGMSDEKDSGFSEESLDLSREGLPLEGALGEQAPPQTRRLGGAWQSGSPEMADERSGAGPRGRGAE